MRPVLVAGELNADLVMTGLPSLPVLGRELLGDSFRMALGSSSAIAASRLSRLGVEVDFVGWVGDDDIGRFVLKELAHYGVGTSSVEVFQNRSTGVTIALTYANDRAFMTYPGVMSDFDGAALTPELLKNYKHLHVGSFFLQTALQPNLPHIFRQAHELGLTTSLDSGWDPTETWMRTLHLRPTLAETDIFLPNEDEVNALSEGASSLLTLATQVRGMLVVKQGVHGATVFDKQGNAPIQAAAVPVKVVDTTGAGDAFNAGFLYTRIIEGAAIADALAFATACGSEAVTQVGGATNAPTAAAIRAWLKKQKDVI
jgi:sugar/nucleoside kinase (ribokinase family)